MMLSSICANVSRSDCSSLNQVSIHCLFSWIKSCLYCGSYVTIRIINCKSTPFLAFVQYHNNGIYLFLLTVISQHGLQIEGLGYDNFGGRRHAVGEPTAKKSQYIRTKFSLYRYRRVHLSHLTFGLSFFWTAIISHI